MASNSTLAISSSSSLQSTSLSSPSSVSSSEPSTSPSPSPSSSSPSPTSTSSSLTPSSTSTPTPTTSSSIVTPTTSTTTTTESTSSSAPTVVPTTKTVVRTGSGSTTTVVVTSYPSITSTAAPTSSSSTATTSSLSQLSPDANAHNSTGSGGLSPSGVTAVAVVVPVVVVGLLVVLGIFLWRKRKSKKAAEEMRRKEVEDYGFNPNNDPTLPTVASESGLEMAEDQTSGYRGWGAATGSNRKMSTTLSGGLTQGPLSDNGSNAYHPGGSPTGQASDAYSGDPLVNRRETMTSDDLGALGAIPAGQAATQVRRGPSNASSSYSHGGHSDASDDRPGVGVGTGFDYNGVAAGGFGYNQHGPYGDGTYNGASDSGMPIVRDVSARRNTRIQQPGSYQQGNSGIAQNF